MNRQLLKVGRIIHASFSESRSIVLDLHHYSKWWKRFKLSFDTTLNTILFQPLPFIHIKLGVVETGTDFITFNYLAGPFTGYGIWKLKEIEPGKTNITYTVLLSGRTTFSHFLLSTRLFKWKHSRDIYYLLKRIETWSDD